MTNDELDNLFENLFNQQMRLIEQRFCGVSPGVAMRRAIEAAGYRITMTPEKALASMTPEQLKLLEGVKQAFREAVTEVDENGKTIVRDDDGNITGLQG